MNSEQRKKFSAQQTALLRSAAASTKFQLEQAAKAKVESKPEKPGRRPVHF
jgi:hypothetical protein